MTKAINSNERTLSYDVARVLSFIWIVFFWHLNSTLEFYGGRFITNVALGSFFYISGRLLSERYEFANHNQVLSFYRKRLRRIWILYCIAALTIPYGNDVYDLSFRIRSCFLAVSYPKIRTLWFIIVLFYYYAVTPLVCRKISLRHTILHCLFIEVLFSFVAFTFCDFRIALYFPIYAIGLLIGKTRMPKFSLTSKQHTILISAGLVVALIALVCLPQIKRIFLGCSDDFLSKFDLIFPFFCVLLGVPCLMWICAFSSWEKGRSLIAFLSYVSFTGYLFHRHCFWLVTNISHYYCDNKLITNILAILITISFSFIVQKTFDHIQKRLIDFDVRI